MSVNVKIHERKRSLAEIDIIARRGNQIDIYEVKCSHRIFKAKKQLVRIKRILNIPESDAYFYCGASKMLVTV